MNMRTRTLPPKSCLLVSSFCSPFPTCPTCDTFPQEYGAPNAATKRQGSGDGASRGRHGSPRPGHGRVQGHGKTGIDRQRNVSYEGSGMPVFISLVNFRFRTLFCPCLWTCDSAFRFSSFGRCSMLRCAFHRRQSHEIYCMTSSRVQYVQLACFCCTAKNVYDLSVSRRTERKNAPMKHSFHKPPSARTFGNNNGYTPCNVKQHRLHYTPPKRTI